MEALRDYQILNNFIEGIIWNDVLFNFMLKIVLIWFHYVNYIVDGCMS